jgi:SHS2 domain-containing protein
MSPYLEIEHTADWALKVWAPTLAELLVDAARGMYALLGVGPAAQVGDVRRRLELSGDDSEMLLVAWLQELLYFNESESLVFDRFEIEALTTTRLDAELTGRLASQPAKIIKAVTYHNLAIRPTADGLEATLVFDV